MSMLDIEDRHIYKHVKTHRDLILTLLMFAADWLPAWQVICFSPLPQSVLQLLYDHLSVPMEFKVVLELKI
jgi:hypothetical protein